MFILLTNYWYFLCISYEEGMWITCRWLNLFNATINLGIRQNCSICFFYKQLPVTDRSLWRCLFRVPLLTGEAWCLEIVRLGNKGFLNCIHQGNCCFKQRCWYLWFEKFFDINELLIEKATEHSCDYRVLHFLGMQGRKVVTWLILPVVICLSQRLSHACLSINNFILWNCEWLIKSVIVYLMVLCYMDNCGNSRANTCI